jgi:cardiolipin synthase
LPVNTVRLLLSRIDLRNHRKIGVIDGQIGYTGSNNLADAAFAPKAKFAPWVDCSVRIDGPAVKELQVLFLEDWYMETDEFLDDALSFRPTVHADGLPIQIIATGPNFYNEATTQLVQACLQVARREIVLTTPYFVPDQVTITNLCVAARRGVQTILVLPKNNDSRLVAAASRSSYRTLLEAGVELHEYRNGLLHAKTISIDKDIAFVMSANLDRRSYELNFECGAIIYDTDFTSQLRFLQQAYLEKSDLIDAAAWSNRPMHANLRDTAAGLLAPLL